REWMRERSSLRTLVRELRERAPELIEAARALPAAVLQLARRAPAAPLPATPVLSAAQFEALRLELGAQRRRRDSIALGAALLLGGLVWLALARNPAWLAWALLGAGALQLAYGLWR